MYIHIIIVIGYVCGTGMAEGLVQEGTLLVTSKTNSRLTVLLSSILAHGAMEYQ